jgi:Rod binding domain-containing protein
MAASMLAFSSSYTAGSHPSHSAPRDPKLWSIAQDFESVFLGSMFSQITNELKGEGPLGNQGTGSEAWRSMLTEELGKTVAQSGGVGIAPQIYSELIHLQSMHGSHG